MLQAFRDDNLPDEVACLLAMDGDDMVIVTNGRLAERDVVKLRAAMNALLAEVGSQPLRLRAVV